MKPWYESQSLNFRLRPTKEMLTSTGVVKDFQSVPTRSRIPKELRPRDFYKFDESYVMAYISYVFDGIGATVNQAVFKETLNVLASDNRSVMLDIKPTTADRANDYTDDFSKQAVIADLIIKFLSTTENHDSPRNAKACNLAYSIKNLIDADIVEERERQYHSKRLAI